MAGGRRLNLILQAHLKHLIDYSKFESSNLNDLTREVIIHRSLESEVLEKLLSLKFMRQATAQGFPAWDTNLKVFTENANAAMGTYAIIGKIMAPWLDWAEKDENKTKVEYADEMMQKWEEIFGKLDSPEVQSKLKEYQSANNRPSGDLPPGAVWSYR